MDQEILKHTFETLFQYTLNGELVNRETCSTKLFDEMQVEEVFYNNGIFGGFFKDGSGSFVSNESWDIVKVVWSNAQATYVNSPNLKENMICEILEEVEA